jgi:NADPH:quinone reductase-like Zn-dependent oxidoreductase
MQAVLIHQTGDPAVLGLEEAARKPDGVSHEQAAAIPVAGEFVLGLGADEYVDYTQQDVTQAVSGVDLALDTVGGDTTESLVPTVRDGGILVTIAAAPPEQAARERGVRAELMIMSPNPDQLARIADLVAAGDVHVEIATVLPLSEVRRAHELSESRHTRGKIILTPGK